MEAAIETIAEFGSSTTLEGSLEWNNSTLIEGDVAEEVLGPKERTGGDVPVYGSADLARTLMRHGLADEYRIWVRPSSWARQAPLRGEWRGEGARAGGHDDLRIEHVVLSARRGADDLPEKGRCSLGLDEQPHAGKERRSRMTVLRGERMLLRPGRTRDLGALVRIRNEPEVARRWGSADIEDEVEESFVGNDEAFVIEVDGEVVGAIQYHEEDDPMYRHAGIDVFLATSRHGRGLGTEAVRVLARYLFEERGHHRLTIDPAADNAPAIRSYEKVGFRPVGIMRLYERGPDGAFHDGLLMDMLRGELRP